MPNGQLTGSVNTTLSAAVACNPALDGDTSSRADNLKISLLIDNAGMLKAGDIGSMTIPKTNNCGIWLYGAGRNIDLTGTVMNNISGPAILLQAKAGQVLEDVRGHLTLGNIMTTEAGEPLGGKGAVIKRSPTGEGVVRSIDLSLEVRNTSAPLVNWLQSGPLDDHDISIKADLDQSPLDHLAYPGKSLINLSANGAGTIRNVQFNVKTLRAASMLRISGRVTENEIKITQPKRS
jgi:hypothetical protein